MPTLDLQTLTCIKETAQVGKDKIYIDVNGGTVWGPKEMGKKDTEPVDVQLSFDTNAMITLYEKDSLSKDDYLGTKSICGVQTVSADFTGSQTLDFNQNGAYYQLSIQVSRS